MGIRAAGGWGPGTRSSASSTPPASSLREHRLAPGRSLVTVCPVIVSVLPLVFKWPGCRRGHGKDATVSHCRMPPARTLGMSVQYLLNGHIWSRSCFYLDSGYSWYVLYLVTPAVFYNWDQRWSQSLLGLSCGQRHLRHLGVSLVLACDAIRDWFSCWSLLVHILGLSEVWGSKPLWGMPETFCESCLMQVLGWVWVLPGSGLYHQRTQATLRSGQMVFRSTAELLCPVRMCHTCWGYVQAC